MARRGRKKKQNVKREPNGRVSRAGQGDKVFETVKTQPHRRHLSNFRDARAADVLGNLSIAGLITSDQYEAGKVWRQVVASHRRAMCIPSPDPRAGGADYLSERVDAEAGGISLDDRSEDERDVSAIRRYQRVYRALYDAGRAALLEVNRVCIRDESVNELASLRAGLTALSRHFGMFEPDAAENPPVRVEGWRAA